jgi:hypothetical protein
MALDVIDISAEGLPAYVVVKAAQEGCGALKAAVPPYEWR